MIRLALKDQIANFYFIVVCESQQQRNDLIKRLGYPIHEQYVSGGRLSARMKDHEGQEA